MHTRRYTRLAITKQKFTGLPDAGNPILVKEYFLPFLRSPTKLNLAKNIENLGIFETYCLIVNLASLFVDYINFTGMFQIWGAWTKRTQPVNHTELVNSVSKTKFYSQPYLITSIAPTRLLGGGTRMHPCFIGIRAKIWFLIALKFIVS